MNKNAKLVSLKVPEKVYPILKLYQSVQSGESDLIFPDLTMVDFSNDGELFLKTKATTKKLNKYLKQIANKAGIRKKVTMHIARHTFGNLAGDAIPVQMLQKLYRHSSITTTMQYQSNFISEETDKALEQVIGF